MIGIIDYGMGNIGSVANILLKVGGKNIVVTDVPEKIKTVDYLILPGVGAFDAGMRKLNENGLAEAIKDAVIIKNIPILGICLGMQLLGKWSDEGTMEGLGLIPFVCKKFLPDKNLKVPHMGWDYVKIENHNTKITRNLPEIQRYYFVHSYYAMCENRENSIMTCNYGSAFTAAVWKNNVYGVQFHPEKSHQYGMKIVRNFIGEK